MAWWLCTARDAAAVARPHVWLELVSGCFAIHIYLRVFVMCRAVLSLYAQSDSLCVIHYPSLPPSLPPSLLGIHPTCPLTYGCSALPFSLLSLSRRLSSSDSPTCFKNKATLTKPPSLPPSLPSLTLICYSSPEIASRAIEVLNGKSWTTASFTCARKPPHPH